MGHCRHFVIFYSSPQQGIRTLPLSLHDHECLPFFIWSSYQFSSTFTQTLLSCVPSISPPFIHICTANTNRSQLCLHSLYITSRDERYYYSDIVSHVLALFGIIWHYLALFGIIWRISWYQRNISQYFYDIWICPDVWVFPVLDNRLLSDIWVICQKCQFGRADIDIYFNSNTSPSFNGTFCHRTNYVVITRFLSQKAVC